MANQPEQTKEPRRFQRTISVTRRVGEYTYSMQETITYPEDMSKDDALAVFQTALMRMQNSLSYCVSKMLQDSDAAIANEYKKPAVSGNTPPGITFDPSQPGYKVTAIIVNMDRGKRYVKVITDKVKDFGFSVWPDFPEKNQWDLIKDKTGVDVAHCDPNEYKLQPSQQFLIKLGKDKNDKSRIMEFVWNVA